MIEVLELEDFMESLGNVMVTDARDKWVWSPDKSGLFSTRSFKSIAAAECNEEVGFRVKGCGWVPSKCRIFMWRVDLDRIPTRAALVKRNISVESVDCALCGEGVETVEHLFTACNVTMRVWNRFSEWVKIPPIFAFSFKDILSIHKGGNGDKKVKGIIRGLVMVTCWAIWKARNDKIFGNGQGNSEDIFGAVRSLGFFWLKNRSAHKNIVWREWCNYPLYMF
ncbi:uncharacterized protein LOC110925461 [Helianthus annuus]|uniref:uncharacterized protein LOC110925461 n=1 Tax=Helianthus annuus TaxID=4232 RepID=UPI000B9004A9|nr:uncharacterized protein LOC110925461 [Helianthus annuus]